MNGDLMRRGRDGVYNLQEVVLDVLYEHYEEGFGIGAADLSRHAGIYRDRGPSNILNDAIVHGLLASLQEQRKVERAQQERGRGGWRLTPAEFNRRQP